MKIVLWILLLNLCCGGIVFSQHGLTLQTNEANKQFELYIYNGFEVLPISIGKTNANGLVQLQYDDGYRGMGLIKDSDDNKYLMTLNGQEVDIKLNSSPTEVIRFEDKENNLLNIVLKEHTNRLDKLGNLYWLLSVYKNDSSNNFVKSMIGEIKLLKLEESEALSIIDDEYYISYYLPLRYYVESISMALSDYPDKTWDELIDEINNYNFADDRLWHSGLIDVLIENYIVMCETVGANQGAIDSIYSLVNSATNHIITDLKNEPGKTQEVAHYLYNLYEKRSLFACAEYLSLYYLENSENKCLIDENLQQRMEQYRIMKKGNAAPEIVFEEPVGKYEKLSEIDFDYTLVFFWASWCEHCMKELPRILLLQEKLVNNDIQVLTISLDTDENNYKEAIKYYPWINYCDFKGWEGKAAKDYFVYATPTMYLIDNVTGKIVTKLVDSRHLEAVIDQGYLGYHASGDAR